MQYGILYCLKCKDDQVCDVLLYFFLVDVLAALLIKV